MELWQFIIFLVFYIVGIALIPLLPCLDMIKWDKEINNKGDI